MAAFASVAAGAGGADGAAAVAVGVVAELVLVYPCPGLVGSARCSSASSISCLA